MNWQRYFQPHILERGIDYFNKKRVVLLEKEEDYLSAEVIGSETYEFDCNCCHQCYDIEIRAKINSYLAHEIIE